MPPCNGRQVPRGWPEVWADDGARFRDRALLWVMLYSLPRVSAVLWMRGGRQLFQSMDPSERPPTPGC